MNKRDPLEAYLRMECAEEDGGALEARLAQFRANNDPESDMAGPCVLAADTVAEIVGDWKNGWYWLGRQIIPLSHRWLR